jgi:hypothetical protein
LADKTAKMSKYIRLGVWNINGHINKELGNKLKLK